MCMYLCVCKYLKNCGHRLHLFIAVITEETIQEWKIEEKATLCSKAKPVKATWEEIYVEQLQRLNSLRECIQEDKDPDLIEQYTRLQKSVACLEKAKGISKRWHKNELKYISANDVLQRRCQKNILDKMREGAQERMFLLDLKKKYYDGQAVAKRLCGQVNRSSNNLKKLLAKYKAFGGNDNTTFADVSNPDGNIYLPACE
ncbi:uncharacterized protein LOC117114248, partial [Anneissia japonica]|uniref:uncharacterized protein LOC117114248 n=1 Tax=Anneissia japonica TaxID=1529436 RepID=UPI00142551FE